LKFVPLFIELNPFLSLSPSLADMLDNINKGLLQNEDLDHLDMRKIYKRRIHKLFLWRKTWNFQYNSESRDMKMILHEKYKENAGRKLPFLWQTCISGLEGRIFVNRSLRLDRIQYFGCIHLKDFTLLDFNTLQKKNSSLFWFKLNSVRLKWKSIWTILLQVISFYTLEQYHISFKMINIML
jgi:hypothetical protein